MHVEISDPSLRKQKTIILWRVNMEFKCLPRFDKNTRSWVYQYVGQLEQEQLHRPYFANIQFLITSQNSNYFQPTLCSLDLSEEDLTLPALDLLEMSLRAISILPIRISLVSYHVSDMDN